MPFLSGLLLPVKGAPIELKIKVPRSNPTDVIKTVLNIQSDPVTTTCKIGLLYSSGGSDLNPLASRIYSEFSGGASSETYGPCFMIGEDEKGGMVNLPTESIEKVAELYHTLTGTKAVGLSYRKKEPQGPKKAKKAADFFKKKFFAARSTELRDQNLKFEMAKEAHNASAAWAKLSAEEKAPFLASEAEDKARFEKDKAEWNLAHPPKPTRPKTAVHFYNQAHPDKDNRPDYSTLVTEERAPYEAKANDEKKKYDEQLIKFKAYCEANGKNYEQEMKPKSRSKPAAPADAPTKKKKTNSGKSVQPTTEKKKSKVLATPVKKTKPIEKDSEKEKKPKAKRKKEEVEEDADEAAAEEEEAAAEHEEQEEEVEEEEEGAGSDKDD